nr:pyruvate dehydrogenase (acetyl-transferring) kinase, mitochondrial-like [Arachis hypogaea]
MSDEKEFTKIIKAIKVRHDNVVPTMALGVSQLKRTMNANTAIEDHTEIHEFLDRFFLSRIGIRMLIGQHLELHKPNPNPNCVGCIHKKMSPLDVTRNAIEDARAMCYREYGNAPEVTIYGDPDFTFPFVTTFLLQWWIQFSCLFSAYTIEMLLLFLFSFHIRYVPSHLHHMVFELVKNSLRAIQERFMDDDRVAPPIRIIIADGIEDVTIKISDEGGGIPRS